MQSSASPSTSYAAPAVISLGEEYTDAMLPSFDSEVNDDGFYYSSSSDSETDSEESDDDDDERYSSLSQNRRSSIVPSLWHAEHARLLHLQAAVLDNERAAWTREKRLESEVARIKVDLARLQQKQQHQRQHQYQQQNQHQSNAACASENPLLPPVRTLASNEPITAISPTPSSSTHTPPRCAGPRGPRPKPQQPRSSNDPGPATPLDAQTRTAHSNDSALPPLLPKFSFESLKEQTTPKPEPEQIAVTVLSHHLTQARSQRAQERQKRRNEHERMRELATLLTLGSEVRKWEERLAWSQFHSNTRAAASDDSHLNTESVAKATTNNNNDTDVDPRGKRLSRSSSLPSNRMSYVPPLPSSQQSTASSSSSSKPPSSPALPSLALSPLWRVSAEMILRRRQLSERPRRTPPTPLVACPTTPVVNAPVLVAPVPVATVPAPVTAPSTGTTTTLARPAHTLRGPRDKRTVSSSSPLSGNCTLTLPPPPSSVTLTLTAESGTSSGSGSLSAKRNSIPPPISIPPSGPFCTSTTVASGTTHLAVPLCTPTGSCTPTVLLSKTTPVKPSALKWAFTAADLAREMEEEEQSRQREQSATTSALGSQSTCCAELSGESSEESGSDDSGKSSSDGSRSSSSGQECPGNVERRGRARFSWRKSIPKDGNASTNANVPPPPPIASVGIET